jgi:REP element-mobilizing transposase RayT
MAVGWWLNLAQLGRPIAGGNSNVGYSDAMAWFLTFSTYGTHLPGDERGSTNRQLGRVQPQSAFRAFAAGQMTETSFCLVDAADRQAVLNTIIELCERREWRLIALHIRPTHVHGLVQAERVSPSRVMGDWKANASQTLRRRWPARQHFWTRGGNIRSVKNSIDVVRTYILEGQGAPMETYSQP